MQFGELIFGIQLAADIRNLTFLSTILSRTVTNDKNDKTTWALKEGEGEWKWVSAICGFNFHALAVSKDFYD